MAISNQTLIEALVERELIPRSQIEALLEAQNQSYQKALPPLAGKAYLINPIQQTLEIQTYPEGKPLKSIALSDTESEFDKDDWDKWGTHTLLITPEEGQRSEQFDWDPALPYGLVIGEIGSYLYNQGKLNTPYLGLSPEALYGANLKGKPQTRPFDLFLNTDKSKLLVTNRGSGKLWVIDLASESVQFEHTLRKPGSQNILNMAQVGNRVFITDSQSTQFYILDLTSGELTRQKAGLGVLGNLVLAPDQKHFFLLSIKPHIALHYFDIETMKSVKEIKLKGDLYKVDSSDPGDLLTLTENGEQLAIMTYINDPEPFTPVISIIDVKKVKTVRRYSLKDDVKPYQIATAIENPVFPYTRSIEELLLENKLIEGNALWKLKRELRQLAGEDPEDEEPPEERVEEEAEYEEEETQAEAEEEPEEEQEEEPVFLEIQHQIMDISTLQKDDTGAVMMTPAKANAIDLPPAANTEIFEILVNTLQRATEDDITEYEDVVERLTNESDKIRQELEIYDAAVVQLEDVFEGQSLKTVILREAILVMLELKDSVLQQDSRIVPSHCPNCNVPLMGQWDCNTCGFELENPQRARQRRLSSVESIANQPPGHVIIPDPEGLRLLQLNAHNFISWSLDPDQLSCDYPTDTIWLENGNLLVTDKEGSSVLEIGVRGKIFWKYDGSLSERHELDHPVKATPYFPEESKSVRILIVDQGNHRVLEVDKENHIHWEFGMKGLPGRQGQHLDTPSDIQFTYRETYLITDTNNHRVIEVKDNSIEKVFGPKLDLKKPTCARRIFNGNTLIVDSGNYRLIEVDEKGELVNECTYYHEELGSEYKLVAPHKMVRLTNRDILILDENMILRINLQRQALVWYSKMDQLKFQPNFSEPEEIVDENGRIIRVFKKIDHGDIQPARLSQKINFNRMQQLIAERLRHDPAFADYDLDNNNPALMSRLATSRLKNLIADRQIEKKKQLKRDLSLETYQPSEIFQAEGLKLPNIRRYCIDRHHNALIRINRKGEVKWHYGFETSQVLSRPHHIEEQKRNLLIADTANNRIVELSKADKEVTLELKGPEDSPLSGPRSATYTPFGKILIADQRNKRLVELDRRNRMSWEFNTPRQISSPQYAEALENGNILFADSMMNSIREINREGRLVWSYGSRLKGRGPGQLFAPEFATRLPNGNTLIADTRNSRVLEVDINSQIIWSCEKRDERRKLLNPNYCYRLEDGTTVIHYNNHREVIEVGPDNQQRWYFRMGNDVFKPPVKADESTKELNEKPVAYYNPIEKRLLKTAKENGMKSLESHISLMDNCQMKSVRASLILMNIENTGGTVVKTFPSPEELLADKFGNHLIITCIIAQDFSPEELKEKLSCIGEVEEVKVQTV